MGHQSTIANICFVVALVVASFVSTLIGIKLIFVSEGDPLSEGGNARLPLILLESPVSDVYENSTYLFPIVWGSVIAILIWKGKTRTNWSKQGYDRNMFKLVAGMRGSITRVRLLQILGVPKNKLQLADELGMNWKTIDNHINLLQKHGLIDEMALVGTSKYFIISEQGKRILSLVSESNNNSESSNI